MFSEADRWPHVMINSQELAEEALEEVHILGRGMKFNNEELTPQEQLERAITQFPLPDGRRWSIQ
jgi:hypothetical protein